MTFLVDSLEKSACLLTLCKKYTNFVFDHNFTIKRDQNQINHIVLKTFYYQENKINLIMKQAIAILTLLFSFFIGHTQMVSLDPVGAGAEQEVKLIFDATEGNGELIGFDKVYMHHGVVFSGPDGTDWNHVIGNWGQDDGVGEMTKVTGETDKWEITFSPTLRTYFGVPDGETIFRVSCVFRSADGAAKGTLNPGEYGWGTVAGNQDIYVNLDANNFIGISNPTNDIDFISLGESANIEAFASSEATSMKIFINEGAGYEEKASVTSGTSIAYNYMPSVSTSIFIKVTATINGEDLESIKSYQVVVIGDPEIADLPEGLITGINYYEEDQTKVTLVLEAPGKDFVHVVGGFTNWIIDDSYHMKKTPDGELFWVDIIGLTPMQEYVFQYWIEGTIKVGDSYADQVADPWNDHWIEEEVYPDLPEYDKTDYGFASVLQTGQQPYEWNESEDTWEKPDVDHLVIYELHIRDFLGSHSYLDLIDTLDYLKRLGVNAIELMPVNEFEGNESWGYNPAYYFAPDKYYGTKDDLKSFIEAAHQEGMAVIMDMVLNHAFGQNPMVKMYFDNTTGKPSADNPWFNENYVGPYEWGYDFNHESDYTKAFMDRVNTYWLEEYHFDGFRFDFTKGFTNYAPGGNIDGFDQSRINILQRMADVIWEADQEAYILLEHWGQASEELQLSNYGMKMWRNKSYDYVPVTTNGTGGNFNGIDATTHVTFFDSHDERRIAEHTISEGHSNGSYDIKNPLVMFERMKMVAAFNFLAPGPKMMWQFDELGYDIHIDYNGRTGNKPLPWGPDGLGYYEDSLRQYIYDAYKGILDVRNQIGPDLLAAATKSHKNTGSTRRLSYNTTGIDVVLLANFGLDAADISPQFSQTGTWHDYFSGDSLEVVNLFDVINLKAGEWHIYTSQSISDGLPGVVEIFDNPVTISPDVFTKNDEIVIRFDATKAWKNGTDGLVGADKVYMHSGVLIDHPDSTTLSHIVGDFTDNGIGEMVEVEEDIWEITIVPGDYYSIAPDIDIYQLGMYFRDGGNLNLGMGFRDGIIYANVASGLPFIIIDPPAFTANTPITITFNAKQGNRELLGADKVYMHSGMGTVDTSNPATTAWDNAVGNWGEDDGVGEMTPVAGATDLWEITLVPQAYYGLSNGDFPYWLGAVFRSADGNSKGTGTPGPIENGFIANNLDFFIQNQGTVSVNDWGEEKAEIFPNPTSGYVNLSQYSGDLIFRLFGMDGKQLFSFEAANDKTITLPVLPNGMYIYKIQSGEKVQSGKLILH
jgi:glycosidase